MFFALGVLRGDYGEICYRNLHIGGFKTFEGASNRIIASTGRGVVVNEERRVVAAVSSSTIKRNPL